MLIYCSGMMLGVIETGPIKWANAKDVNIRDCRNVIFDQCGKKPTM